MDRLLQRLFNRLIRHGTVHVTTAAGATFTLGDGSRQPIAVRFNIARAQLAVLLDPEFKLGEAYMDGTFVVEQGSIADLLALVLSQDQPPPGWARPQWLARYIRRRLQQFNPRARARKNAAHHYDLDSRLYSLFLDADRQYSCAYFRSEEHTSELQSLRHLVC